MFHKNLRGSDLHSPSSELVENNSGSTISALKCVTFDSIGTTYPAIRIADGAVDVVRGIVKDDILNNNAGYIVCVGFLNQIDTSAWSSGTVLYADSSGDLTSSPVGSPLGTVLKQDSSAGVIYLGNPIAILSAGGEVSSVFGRSGAVVAQSGDYSAFYLSILNNLSDLNDASVARSNLGLGTAAVDNAGDLTENVSSVLNIVGGTGAILGSGSSIEVKQASALQDGYLSATDFATFNGKQDYLGFTPEDVANKDTDGTLAANSDTKYPSQKAVKTYVDTGLATKQNTGNYITALTGDGSASGPGSANFTLATVVSPNTATKVTFNAKGLVTAGTVLSAGDIPDLSSTYVTQSEVGNANGVASLDSGGKVPSSQLPAMAQGDLTEAVSSILTIVGGTNAVWGSGTSIEIAQASGSASGYLSSTDWNTFNGKQNALTLGNLTDAGTDGITVTGGSGSVVGSGTSIAQHVSDATHNGYLSSTDWSIFNNKQPAGSYITAITGDVSASGPGSVSSTLATVNSNVGSFTLGNFTVNGKGLITAASTTTPGSISSSTNGVVVASGSNSTVGPNVTVNFPLARAKYTLIVDGGSTSTATPDGSWHSPYITIQAALNAIGTPSSGADAFTRWSIFIAPGAYDEALTIPSCRIITLIGMGPWTLGDAAGNNHTSTTPRSITWNCNPTDKNGKTYFPHFEITNLGEIGAISGDEIQGNTADISGNITITTTASSAETDVEFTLNNVSVRGNIDATGVIGNVETVIANSFINGTVNLGITLTPTTAAKGRLHALIASRITGLLTTSSYSMIANSRLSGGMTIAASVQTTPNEVGIVNSELLGVYSGAAFTLDGVSYYWFSNLGGSLGSGGSLIFMNDAASTAYTPTTSANWSSVPATVKAGLDTLASSGVAKSQSQNIVLASPNGSSGVPSFRALVNADIPAALSVSKTVISSQAISASDIDWSAGFVFTKTLGANTTFTFSNKTNGQTIVVRLTNTVSNYTVTWPAVKWANGTPPTMSTGAVSDIYTFIFDGSNVYGSVVQNLS